MGNITRITPFVLMGLNPSASDGSVPIKTGNTLVYTQSLVLSSLTCPNCTLTNITYSGAITSTSTSSLQVPQGSSAQRPTGASGKIRFNTTLTRYEGHNGTAWGSLGGGATGGGTDYIFYENDIVVTTDYTITTGKNAMTAGPITINPGVTVTVPSGSTWTVV